MWHVKLKYASDGAAQIRGLTLAHLPPDQQLAALVAIAAGQVKLIDPTMVQLAAIGGMSATELLEMRRQVGAPIRAKRPSARKADPTPAPEPANVDIVCALRRLGTEGLLKLAEMVERDELARAAATVKTNGNRAVLNGGARHFSI
jgi:hypothetical protein